MHPNTENTEVTEEHITSLPVGHIFVFGSNRAGRHGKGAARVAQLKFGAVNGTGEGLSGRSYGIPTKDRNLNILPLANVALAIARFNRFALANPHLTFHVTKIGCGLAKFKPSDVAPYFLKQPNVRYPVEFLPYLGSKIHVKLITTNHG